MRKGILGVLLGAGLSSGVLAQTTNTATYVELTTEEEVSLARSAGPAEISAEATVWLLDKGEYVVAEEGSNGNHCFVMRSMPQSLEPICYDEEASATVLPWEFEFFRLRMEGKSPEEVDQALATAVGKGELRAPSRPAMSYMLSSGQRLFDPESGQSAGNWKPHLMLYVPYLTIEDVGLTQPTSTMFVFKSGTPMAHLIIVVPEFVDPEM
jgi:hypothetical protein